MRLWNGEVFISKPHYSPDDLVVVMCTGLKDSDGVFIYEGDILNIHGEEALVAWLDDGWKLIGESFPGYDLFPQIRSVTDFDTGEVLPAMWGKIIANRFENPDHCQKDRRLLKFLNI
jgi:uncharacterized phage protein (TIGR01671 family)